MGHAGGKSYLLLLLRSIIVVHGSHVNHNHNPTCDNSSGFYRCVSEQSATCFPSSKFASGRWFSTPRKIVLETANWQSHRIVTRVAEILLRERLGYEVEVRDYIASGSATAAYTDDPDGCGTSYQTSAYCRLKDGAVHINVELWPGSLPPSLAQSLQAKVLLMASGMGELGYEGRSGWFIPVSSLRDVATGPLGDAPWRAIMPLFNSDAVQSSLANHTRLPPPASTCALDHSIGFGSYDCERGTYTSPTSTCCSSSAAASGSCSESQQPCGVLMSLSPMYDYGQNEGALAGSALPMEIQYGDVEAFVERAEAEALPAMIYAWEPWPSFLSKGRFIRVGLTEQTYCTPYGGATASSETRKSNVNVLYENVCDFPGQKLTKMAASSLTMVEAAAFQLTAEFNFSYAQITRAMSDAEYPLAANSTLDPPHADAFNRACGLLKATSGSCSGSGCWERWIKSARASLSSEDRIDAAFRQLLLDPATGSLVSDWMFLWILILAIALAVYVFGRGDDGETSGRGGCTLPNLLRILYRLTRTLITCSFCTTTNPQEMTEPEKKAARSAPATPGDNVDSTITLGRSMIVVSSTDAYVALPILRIDKSAGRSTVSLKTVEEREGNGARRGHNYGAIRTGHEDTYDATEIRVTFEPGARLKFVYVTLLRPAKRATGEHDCADFSIALSNVAQQEGQVTPAIGPVTLCLVRIIEPMEFPKCILTSSMRQLNEMPSSIKQPMGFADDLVEPSSTRPARRISFGVIEDVAQSGREKVADVAQRARVVLKFLRWALRIRGLAKKVVWHQATHLILACFNHFLQPLAYSYIIYFGVERKRADVAMWLALLMVTVTLIECAQRSHPHHRYASPALLLLSLGICFSSASYPNHG